MSCFLLSATHYCRNILVDFIFEVSAFIFKSIKWGCVQILLKLCRIPSGRTFNTILIHNHTLRVMTSQGQLRVSVSRTQILRYMHTHTRMHRHSCIHTHTHTHTHTRAHSINRVQHVMGLQILISHLPPTHDSVWMVWMEKVDKLICSHSFLFSPFPRCTHFHSQNKMSNRFI